MQFLPVFLDLRTGPVMLVGAGELARAKLRLLLAAGARVRWFALGGDEQIGGTDAQDARRIERIERGEGDPVTADLTGVIAILCAGAGAVGEAMSARARAVGLPVNVMDDLAHSTLVRLVGTGISAAPLSRTTRWLECGLQSIPEIDTHFSGSCSSAPVDRHLIMRSEQSSSLSGAARELNSALEAASPTDIIRAALNEVGGTKLAVVSSFGTESAALLKFTADVDSAIPVIFLDTGWLFEETLAYRDLLTDLFGLRDVRTMHPLADDLACEDKGRDLWFSDPDRCCFLRKVQPLARALQPFRGWLNGRKRFQGGARAVIPVVEADGERLKFNPLANVTLDELKALYAAMDLPPHPLVASGFTSVGCMPCTSRTAPGEDSRAGRWRGKRKTECGIHVAKTS